MVSSRFRSPRRRCRAVGYPPHRSRAARESVDCVCGDRSLRDRLCRGSAVLTQLGRRELERDPVRYSRARRRRLRTERLPSDIDDAIRKMVAAVAIALESIESTRIRRELAQLRGGLGETPRPF